MIYHITKEGKGSARRKTAHPIKDRQQLMALRNSEENLQNLAKARQGDTAAKAQERIQSYRLVQLLQIK